MSEQTVPATDVTGDPGLFGPDSVTWRVHSDPVLVIGGLRALLLQAMHPDVTAGFVQSSGYRHDWWGRLQRTADYVAVATWGTTAEVAQAGRAVRAGHARFRFRDPVDGRERRLDEPGLLLWVHCALVDSMLAVAVRSGLRLSPAEADTYVAEQVRFAELVGLDAAIVPAGTEELAAYMAAVRPALRLDAPGREAVSSLLAPPLAPLVEVATPARLGWTAMASLAFATLPPHVLDLFPAAFRAAPALTPPALVSAGLRAFRLTGLGVRTVVPALRRAPAQDAAHRRLGLA